MVVRKKKGEVGQIKSILFKKIKLDSFLRYPGITSKRKRPHWILGAGEKVSEWIIKLNKLS